jgi:purine-binding chemotaxis protein CheW
MEQTQAVFFSADQGNYAINIENVERIIGFSEITPLPETSDYVLGLLTYQERILPIIDINKRFFNKSIEYNATNKILVIQLEEYKVGLLVEEVKEIKTINDDIIEKPSEIIKGISPEYIKGMIKNDDEIIILLEAEEIFKGDKKAELIELIQED